MVWGSAAKQGVEDLVKRLKDNDPKLTSLHILKHRRFNAEDVSSLCAALHSNTQLSELYASNHALCATGLAALSEMLLVNSTLVSLCVGDNNLGDAGVEALAAGLSGSRSLRRLDLDNKNITAAGARALAAVLAASASLQELVLCRNPLGDSGIAALTATAWNGLQKLDLQNCGLGPASVQALASCPSVAQLQSLDLSNNTLQPETGQHLAKLLQAAEGLKYLRLCDTQLQDEGCAAVVAGLKDSRSLDKLDLTSSGVAARSSASLAGALADGACVRELILAGSAQLDDASVCSIAQAASSCSQCQLTSLDVSGAQIGAPSIHALSRSRLSQLCLLGCPLGEAGAQALAECMRNGGFGTLTDLAISGCGITLEGVQALFQALGCTDNAPMLQCVEIGANPATQDDRFKVQVDELCASRPGLDIHWRSGDHQDGDAGMHR